MDSSDIWTLVTYRQFRHIDSGDIWIVVTYGQWLHMDRGDRQHNNELVGCIVMIMVEPGH